MYSQLLNERSAVEPLQDLLESGSFPPPYLSSITIRLAQSDLSHIINITGLIIPTKTSPECLLLPGFNPPEKLSCKLQSQVSSSRLSNLTLLALSKCRLVALPT
jgi:hypothetical protein